MRTILLSALFTISTVLAIPSASSSAVEPKASMDPRIQKWTRMKIALPDGLGIEDSQIVPMMDMEYPPNSFLRKPLDRHDLHQAGYKNMDLAKNEATFNPVVITPLLSEEQKIDSSSDVLPATGSSRRYKKFLGVKDSGESKIMNVPTAESSISISHDVSLGNEEMAEANPALKGKSLVGVDNYGRRRYLDIPYYDRAADINSYV